MRTQLRAKGLVGNRGGGGDVFKIFFLFPICIIQNNTKSDHFSPKIKLYIHGNMKLNAKS